MPFEKGVSGNPGGKGKSGKIWTDAIKRAIARRGENIEGGLNELADTFLNAVASGDAWALKELGDRLEGKPAQSHTVGNEDGETFKTTSVIEIIPLVNEPDTDTE